MIECKCLAVFHRAGYFREKMFIVSSTVKQVEAHLHPGGNATCCDNMPCINDSRAADATGRGNFSQAINRYFTWRGSFQAIRLFAICRRKSIEQPHLSIDPGARTNAREQGRLGQQANELVETTIVHLLARAETARDK